MPPLALRHIATTVDSFAPEPADISRNPLATSVLFHQPCPVLLKVATTGSCPRDSPGRSTPRPLLVRLAASSWVNPFPAFRLGAESLDRLSRSKSTAAAGRQSPRYPTTKTRRR